MVTYLEFLLVGFFALIKGADMFVDGASGLAKKFHVPGMIIGLTIVAMGTSAPELAVSVAAALRGSNEIAVSNVLGSNFFNVLVVLGICAAIHPVPVNTQIIKRDYPINLIITAVMAGVAIFGLATSGLSVGNLFTKDGMKTNVAVFGHVFGFALVAFFVVYIVWLIIAAKNDLLDRFRCIAHSIRRRGSSIFRKEYRSYTWNV